MRLVVRWKRKSMEIRLFEASFDQDGIDAALVVPVGH